MPRDCRIGIEITGIYHTNLAKHLMDDYDVRIINPFVLSRLKDFKWKKRMIKSLRINAQAVINFLSFNLPLYSSFKRRKLAVITWTVLYYNKSFDANE